MRHSDTLLTVDTYTEPKVVDLAGTVELPLIGSAVDPRIAGYCCVQLKIWG